ncbi:hypothetical protein M8J75_001692 [Diaphorina citri]|nr:hypothetical protein M8J75_001692 [Diaphorina citri]
MLTLPQVLEEVKETLLDYESTGISVMEMSHRSADYTKINNDTQAALRELLNVPNNYKILFLQGGGTGMFAAVAMNLIGRTGKADYVVTGSWSKKAAAEAEKYGKVNLVIPKVSKYVSIPDQSTWNRDPEASYLYYWVEFNYIPNSQGIPLVSDMSSNFLSRKFDVSKFGVIIAGAQKNIGPAGITVVIVREDLLEYALPITPTVFHFKINADNNSVYNTPPTFVVHVIQRVFAWIKRQGGLAKMEQNSLQKSVLLYQEIDNSDKFYECPVQAGCRSRMNVPFKCQTPELDELFLKEAKAHNMIQLKGHRLVGGIRASIYNAITVDEAVILVKFMKEFRHKHSRLSAQSQIYLS